MSLSARIADHVAQARYEMLPPAAIEAAKHSLLDAIGVMLGASGLEPSCQPFVDQALASGGCGESTILGFGAKAPAAQAAFANGALAHALDYEDAFDGAPLHPNAALIPVILALAEQRARVSGRDFLTAAAVGCDVACRLALCVRTPLEAGGWYPPPIFGAYGAAAAGARVLGLDQRQVLDAFSLLLSQVACSGEIKVSPLSHLRAVREAFPAQAAVVAVDLAQRGVRGFDHPLEGKSGFFALFAGGDYDERVLLADLGARYLGTEVSLKPWPSCRGTHAFIEAALALRAEGVRAEDIESIELYGGAIQRMLVEPEASKRAPQTAIDAKFSLPFTVATAFVSGAVALDSFTENARGSAPALALATRVTHHVSDEWGAANAFSGRVAVRLRDSATRQKSVADPLGCPARPLTWGALVDKTVDCAARARVAVSRSRVERLAEAVISLENAPDAAAAVLEALH